MKLTSAEIAHVRSQGLYISQKCDDCGKLLNQVFAVSRTFGGQLTGTRNGSLRNEAVRSILELSERAKNRKSQFSGGDRMPPSVDLSAYFHTRSSAEVKGAAVQCQRMAPRGCLKRS